MLTSTVEVPASPLFEREPGQVWDSLAADCADIEAMELLPELRRAFDEGLIDPQFMSGPRSIRWKPHGLARGFGVRDSATRRSMTSSRRPRGGIAARVTLRLLITGTASRTTTRSRTSSNHGRSSWNRQFKNPIAPRRRSDATSPAPAVAARSTRSATEDSRRGTARVAQGGLKTALYWSGVWARRAVLRLAVTLVVAAGWSASSSTSSTLVT